MARIFTRTLLVPGWLFTFALVIALGTPSDTLRLLILGSGLVVMAIVLGKSSSSTAVSDTPGTIDVRPLEVVPAPRQLRRQRWSSRC